MADFSRFTGGAATEEESRQQLPATQLRPQAEKERAPDYFQRKQEREGNSEWSGGNWGGGSISGRSR
jgi:hypothetical protein